jgi:hypothetical protein
MRLRELFKRKPRQAPSESDAEKARRLELLIQSGVAANKPPSR